MSNPIGLVCKQIIFLSELTEILQMSPPDVLIFGKFVIYKRSRGYFKV